MRKIHFLFILTICVFARGATAENDGDTRLGDDCDDSADCEDIPNAECGSDDVCECGAGYVASSDKSSCLPLAKKIGDKCETAEQCSAISSAECVNNTCVLAQAVQPTIGPPEDECAEDSDCPTFLTKRVCKNGICVLEIPPISPRTAGLDSDKSCAEDAECTAEGTACIEKSCRCKENFVLGQNLKTCLPKAKSLGDKCSESVQCVALNGSVCENEKCTQKLTKSLNNFDEKPFAPPTRIGSSCQTDDECKNVTHAKCREHVCQCQDKYVTSISSTRCLEKAKKEGDPCEEDKQCEDIKGSTCVQKKCVKPGIVGTKLGKQNSGSTTQSVSKLIPAAILLIKVFFV